MSFDFSFTHVLGLLVFRYSFLQNGLTQCWVYSIVAPLIVRWTDMGRFTRPLLPAQTLECTKEAIPGSAS